MPPVRRAQPPTGINGATGHGRPGAPPEPPRRRPPAGRQPTGGFPTPPAAEIENRLDPQGPPAPPRDGLPPHRQPGAGTSDRLPMPNQPPPNQPGPPAHPSLPKFTPLPPPRTPNEEHGSAEQAGPPAGPRRPDVDPAELVSLTTEMEPIDEATQMRRKVDHTLARFSAVHDEMAEEERKRKARRILPWGAGDAQMDAELTHMAARPVEAPPEPHPATQSKDHPDGAGRNRLQQDQGRRRHRTVLTAKVLALIVAILVFVVTALAWGFKTWFDAKFNQVSALDQNSADVQNPAAQADDENFLLVGSDTRAGATADEHVGDANEVQGARADTVMIAHVPKDRSRVEVISFPRDLEVTRPACNRWDSNTGKYGTEQVPSATEVKLNSVYSVGGPTCVTKTIQKISGLKINHFIGIDFQGFKGMVDAVQGVQVCVERPLRDSVLGMIVPQAGKAVNLTGDQALAFVRARHVINDPTSDYGRIIRQQRFLSSLLRKAMSSQVLFDPSKLSNFVNAFAGSTFTDNVNTDQLMTLGQSLQRLNAGGVMFITVPTVGTANSRGNEVLREADTRSLFDAIINDTPLPGEKPAQPAPGQQAKPVDPHTVKIQVLNGGNTTEHIASNTADKLKDIGYQVVRVDNGPAVPHTVVRYGPDHADAAKALAASIPGAKLQADQTMAGAVVLSIGPDFGGTVKSGKDATHPSDAEKVPQNLSTVNGADVSCA